MLIGKFRSQLKVALVLHKVEGRGPSLRGNQGSNMLRASPGVMAMRCKFSLLHFLISFLFFGGGGAGTWIWQPWSVELYLTWACRLFLRFERNSSLGEIAPWEKKLLGRKSSLGEKAPWEKKLLGRNSSLGEKAPWNCISYLYKCVTLKHTSKQSLEAIAPWLGNEITSREKRRVRGCPQLPWRSSSWGKELHFR